MDLGAERSLQEEKQEAWLSRLEARAKARLNPFAGAENDRDRLLYELSVHRVELEMQNQELVESQLELAESCERYRSLLAAAPMGYLAVDGRGRISDVNPAGARLLGGAMAELVGTHLQTALSESDADRFHLRLCDCLSTGMAQRCEVTLAGTGASVPVRLQMAPGEPGAGAAATCWVYMSNLAEQVDSHGRLGEQKLELATRLAEGIARRYDHLLTVLSLGFHTLTRRDAAAGGRQREQMGALVADALQQSRTLSTRLHGLLGGPASPGDPADASLVVSEMMASVRALLSEHISLDTDPSARACRLRAARHDLEQVVFHLCVRSLETVPAAGEARLRVSREVLVRESSPGTPRSGDYLKLSMVTSAGAGVGQEPTPARAPALHEVPELASLEGLVRRCAGFMDVWGKSGTSGIDVHLPLAQESPQARRAPSTEGQDTGAAQHGAGHKPVVLVVDDDPMVRRAVSRILGLENYQVIAVGSGAEAMDIARTPGQRVDLLLTDVRMPDMNGAELGRHMARLRPELPRLYMSGNTGDVVLEAGATLLAKPFQVAELVAMLADALQNRE